MSLSLLFVIHTTQTSITNKFITLPPACLYHDPGVRAHWDTLSSSSHFQCFQKHGFLPHSLKLGFRKGQC